MAVEIAFGVLNLGLVDQAGMPQAAVGKSIYYGAPEP